MSWYKLSHDIMLKESISPSIDSLDDEEETTLEQDLDSSRPKIIIDKKALLESSQPNQYFAHGQGGDYRMQEGRDLVWNQTPDNFINTSEWNSN